MTSTRIFVLMLAILAVAALLVQAINLPGIVGAFLAGLSVNAAVHDKPAREKLEFFGNSFFIPIFFIVTGFLVNLVVFFHSVTNNFALVSGIILALVAGKWMAAEIGGASLHLYSSRAQDDVVTHVAAGGCDTRGHARRLQRLRPHGTTPDR